MEQLVQWESTTNEEILRVARAEIWKSWRETCEINKAHPRSSELFNPDKLPGFHDPFAGGGSLPLEAQRLGLDAQAGDLNPLAVLINKAMIAVPPLFSSQPPVNPDARSAPESWSRTWMGAQGLAEDVRYYAQWMRSEAKQRLGHLYPSVRVTPELAKSRPDLRPFVGEELTVIAWIWARTVRSPNPAFRDVEVPLASSFMLSTKEGREAYVQPVIDGRTYRFEVKTGLPSDPERMSQGTKAARGASFECLMSRTPIDSDYVKAEGRAKRMGSRLMAMVAEGPAGRVYLTPTPEHEKAAQSAPTSWTPDVEIAKRMTGGNCTPYGLTTFGDLFTARQLLALNTLANLIDAVTRQVAQDAAAAGLDPDETPLRSGGRGGKGVC
jgi:putative DNA methylase